ncbi:hypothetical protein CCAX7_009680 [Capsulimonas corticalis]|uniref:Uncharacterized protein n=1 Tax=Capsulimonas corticalis TaxID=2219043 RepID=A0A402CUC9_9BACT|nr:sigma-70 family RNA polymerase sigma factor [Capsulimonas corticalis]BDI28917.1 hypothetical protein CCAX7_009680 [Capsulimonas corticalis]
MPPSAQETFWSRWSVHEEELFRICLRYMGGRHDDAEDAMASARYKALYSFCSDMSDARLQRRWLIRLTKNLCIDDLRRRRRAELRTVNTDEAEEDIADPRLEAASPESILLTRERSQDLRNAVNDLPAHLRDVYRLRKYEEMEYSEIARRVGITDTNARKRVQLAASAIRSQTNWSFIRG